MIFFACFKICSIGSREDVPVDPDISYVVNMMINLELSWISEALLHLSVADLILHYFAWWP